MQKVMSLKEVKTLAMAEESKHVYTGGWIRSIRQSKNVGFLEIHDGTTFEATQCVIGKDTDSFEILKSLTIGSCVRVDGMLKTGLKGKQTYEIEGKHLYIEGLADPSYPIQKKEHSLEYLRTLPQLRARTQTFNAIFKVRSVLTQGTLKFLEEQDFVYIQSPSITTTDAEGGGEVFRITTLSGSDDYSKDFFGKEAFLSVTGQLNLEPFIGAYRNIYTFGPSFRAEQSNTTRHVAEFWQIEPEMAFVDLDLLMDTIEAMTKYMTQYVLDHAYEELDYLESKMEAGLIEKLKASVCEDYARVDYSDAIKQLKEHASEFKEPVDWETGLFSEHERYLTDVIYKKPVFVTNYPKDQKAFYMRLNEDAKTVGATDLLFPKIGEIVGASEREERYDYLYDQLVSKGLNLDEYQWYLDTRRFGTVRHGGFGIGLERFMRYLTGVENIRDVIAYPRTPGHASF